MKLISSLYWQDFIHSVIILDYNFSVWFWNCIIMKMHQICTYDVNNHYIKNSNNKLISILMVFVNSLLYWQYFKLNVILDKLSLFAWKIVSLTSFGIAAASILMLFVILLL